MRKTNTVAIVLDDHLLFADSFSALIERLDLFDSVYVFKDDKGLTRFMLNNSDLVVYLFLDFYLDKGNSLFIMNEVRRLNRKSKIIVISSVSGPIAIQHIIDHKPNGFVSKSSDFNTIIECLSSLESGQTFICPIISQILESSQTSDNLSFTARELEILQHFAKGLSIEETANIVHLSKHTIVAHRRKMMSKIKVHSITELLSYAREYELI